MTRPHLTPMRLATKEQRKMDWKPWEKRFWKSYNGYRSRMKELREVWSRYDKLTKEQARIWNSKKATDEAKHEAGLSLIEYGTARNIYLELIANASLIEDIDLRLLGIEAQMDTHTVLIEMVGNLAGFAVESLENDLPKAFQTWGKKMLQLRDGLSKEFKKKQTIELKVAKNVHRELRTWVKEREEAREAERLLEQRPAPRIYQ